MSSTIQPDASHKAGVPFREFVALVAMLMAVNAIGLAAMLPALPQIAASLSLTNPNQQQWVISAYLIGMGVSQIAYGPVADRFGRRGPVLLCLSLYAVTSILVAFTTSFAAMMAARALQGVAAAGCRVIATAMVRDRFSGRDMARVMSLAMMVFLAVPILGPIIGGLILVIAPWPVIFHLLAVFAMIMGVWIFTRVPETLSVENRRPMRLAVLIEGARTVLGNRSSMGYIMAMAMSIGALYGFINSAQQLFNDTLKGDPAYFPLLFAFVTGGMVIASFANSQIVTRYGARVVSHSAAIAFIVLTGVHLAYVELLGDSLVSFTLFQCSMLACSGLMGANFGAMAMEPMGSVAGMAAAVQGTLSAFGGTLIGIVIGQSFDGTTTPIAIGYFMCSLGVLASVLLAEGGKLFREQPAEH